MKLIILCLISEVFKTFEVIFYLVLIPLLKISFCFWWFVGNILYFGNRGFSSFYL
ncbi:hypothetical protein DR980_15190 [Flavobacterium psychrolimnae]|uniref:Uncharacterized protein n=1 Tax=Flavobacterium psychrolimnae TaxID=249351 RepID=A0A366AW77_9FLAO|nr:hypothetical protein DR980_15190 [Flavobacterium psychrolimnae]